MKPSNTRREFIIGGGCVGIASVTGGIGLAEGDGGEATSNPAAVVSQHYLATEAGRSVLEDGGTAADAAVAVACALSVVEPWFSSALGGGTWALYYDSETESVTSVDGVGPVGSKATPDDYDSRADRPGIHQSIVPGAWDGWMLWLDEYGNLELDAVLSPAIALAREGYPVSSDMESWLERRSNRIEDRPPAREIYERDDELVEEGETITQPRMAETFEALVGAYAGRREEGRSAAIQAARDYFYRGPIADSIVAFSDERGGYFTTADFRDFEAEIVEPVSIQYDENVRVYQNPPNSQGITQLLALNILKGYDFEGLEPGGADAVHLQAEAIKLAFADRYHHVGDPDRVDVPIAELLADSYASRQRDRIDMDRAMEWPIETGLSESVGGADHTTTFHVVDGDGNAAAVTTSLGAQFLVIGDTGIHINNRMRMIALEEGDPNRLTPGYKVRHTSNPYMATRNGRPYILGGNTGVDTQPQGQTQQFLHVAEFGLDAQTAIDQPRFVSTAFPSTDYPYDADNTLQMEDDFSADLVEELEARGHAIESGGIFGSANTIVLDGDGGVEIGAESRIDTAEGQTMETDGEQ